MIQVYYLALCITFASLVTNDAFQIAVTPTKVSNLHFASTTSPSLLIPSRHRLGCALRLAATNNDNDIENDDDEEEKVVNPYADPNYPEVSHFFLNIVLYVLSNNSKFS